MQHKITEQRLRPPSRGVFGSGRLAWGAVCLWALQGCTLLPYVLPDKPREGPQPPTVWLATDWERAQKELEQKNPRPPAGANAQRLPQRRVPAQAPAGAPAQVSTSLPSVPAPAAPVAAAGGPVAAAAPPGSVQSPGAELAIAGQQCWAQLVKPQPSEQRVQSVVLRDAAVVHDAAAPLMQTINQSVRVKDAARTYKVQEPRFRAVTERVLVSEEVRQLKVVPAVYEDRQEQVLVESARSRVEVCRQPGLRAASPDRSSLQQTRCVVEVPARYTTVTRKVLVTPESVKEEVTPARYKTVTRWVLERDGEAQEVALPPREVELPLQTVLQPAQLLSREVPAQTTEVNVLLHSGAPQLAWRQVLCERDVTPPSCSSCSGLWPVRESRWVRWTVSWAVRPGAPFRVTSTSGGWRQAC